MKYLLIVLFAFWTGNTHQQVGRIVSGKQLSSPSIPWVDSTVIAPELFDGKNQRLDPKDIIKESLLYLGDGIVTYMINGSSDVWVYIPGKGERSSKQLSIAETEEIIRRLDEIGNELRRLQKVYKGSTVSPQTAVRIPPGGSFFLAS